MPAAHCEPVQVDNGAAKYCMKEDTRVQGPWEYGTKPIQRNSKTDWEEVYTNAKRGRLEDIPADIRVRCYSQLKRIEKDHLVVKDSNHLRGVWIYGPSGVGKSRSARRDYPDAYPKLCNKWCCYLGGVNLPRLTFVDIFKDGDRGITLSRLIFCRSKADGVEDQPLLG